MRRLIRHRYRAGLLAVAAAIVLAAPWAGAHAASTEAKVGLKECDGKVPNCRTAESERLHVPTHGKRMVQVSCPSYAPYLWNWTALVSPHIEVTLVGKLVNNQKHPTGGRFRLYEESGFEHGAARVYIGCSTVIPARHIKQERLSYGWHPHASR